MSSAFPHLSRSFARGLAWWSFGIAHTRSSGRRTIATWLALLLGHHVNTIEQRLYEWCGDAPHKAGDQRRTLEVTPCFAPLLAWVLRLWTGTQLALTLDATPLRDRFTCLTVSVVYRGNAIPVAWTILPASLKQAWNPHWLRLLALIQPAIPADWTVLVLTDRGLWSSTLYRAIQAHGWHPFMRITRHRTVRPEGQARSVAPTTLVTAQQPQWRGRVQAFQGRYRLTATLLVWMDGQHADPWCILTDLPATASDAAWYGLRAWCEQGFKCTKRGMWQWHQTRMTDPQRAERLWLALAVATLWLTSVGSAVEDGCVDAAVRLPDLRDLWAAGSRVIRVLRLGWLWLQTQHLHGRPIPLPMRLRPDSWPTTPAILPPIP